MNAASRPIKALVLTIFQEMGESFAKAAGEDVVQVNGAAVQLDVLAGDPRVNPSWQEDITKADALVMLIRFMDVISLDKVKATFRSIPSEEPLPIIFVAYREEGESDFKMSCGACGQKLWVRDQDVGKKGRCPNCRRAFKLPDQCDHLREQLAVPDGVPVLKVNGKEPATVEKALESLVAQVHEVSPGAGSKAETDSFDPDVLKQSTMRIQLSGDTTVDEKPAE